MLFLPFLFFMCVGFSTHVWKFPNRWFFWRLFWRCSWRLILHGRLWKDGYRYNILYQISKTQIQVQIQKVAPPVWKKTHMFGFFQTCVSFFTHLFIWYVFGKSHTCFVFAIFKTDWLEANCFTTLVNEVTCFFGANKSKRPKTVQSKIAYFQRERAILKFQAWRCHP